MQIRPLTSDDLERFVGFSSSDTVAAFRTQVTRLLESARTRLEWCFLAEQDGELVARAGYFAGDPAEFLLFGLEWRGGAGQAGAFVRESAARMGMLGAAVVRAQVNDAFHPRPEARREVLRLAAFELTQEKLRLRFRGGPPAVPDRLAFASLEHVGDEAFVAAIGDVSRATLDRLDRETITRVGGEQAARDYFAFLVAEAPSTALFELARTREGEFVGLAVPYEFESDTGVIGYIGVTPKQRGCGYGRDLLLRGTAALLEAGFGSVIADVDVENAPMLNSFRAAGYAIEARLSVHEAVMRGEAGCRRPAPRR